MVIYHKYENKSIIHISIRQYLKETAYYNQNMEITINNINEINKMLENKTLEYFNFDIIGKTKYEDLQKNNGKYEIDSYVRAYIIFNEIGLGFDNNGHREDYCIYYNNAWMFDERKAKRTNYDGFLHTHDLKTIKSIYFENENKIIIICKDDTRVSIEKYNDKLNLYISERSIH